ncbi:MAG TPA: branched-chain amino acid ABC transporter permease [Acidimicrobiales bacterium]|nr:branched-chain amino acid ABC transporter permease [Acidimicrobiales bacterium]
MHQFVNLTLGGITTGFIFASIALALVLIWRSTRVVNFAQGAMAMFTTYIAVSVIDRHWSYWAALAVALVAGLVLGAVVERVLVRPVESGPPLNAVILTLGLFILLEAIVPMIWGSKTRSYPPHFSIVGYKVGKTSYALSPFDLFTIAAVIVVIVALFVLFQKTTLGLRMRASAFSPEVSRLLGVRVGRMLTLGWALAALVGSLAGILVPPATLSSLTPNYMDPFLIFGFTAAILGGLDSPIGALVGGIAVGLGLTYVGGYISSDLETVGALVILIAVLMVRPEGIFATTRQRRV